VDFTFLFIIVLMLLAAKAQIYWLTGVLFLLLIASSKTKLLAAASVVGLVLAVALGAMNFGENTIYVLVGALVLVVLLIVRGGDDKPHYGGGM
jgi:hypothetical protein